jgi:hypothetical protein
VRPPSGRTADSVKMWGLPDRGLEPHPFYDLQCGAADVDGLAADAKLSRASTSTGR